MRAAQHLARALEALPQQAALRAKDTDALVDSVGHKRFWAGVLSTVLAGPDQLTSSLSATGRGILEQELRDARLVTTLRRLEMTA